MKQLDADAAQTLATLTVRELYLRLPEDLSLEAANALAATTKQIWFHLYLASVPPTLKSVLQWKGQFLYIHDLNPLTPESARILAAWEPRIKNDSLLWLEDVTTLDPSTAEALATFSGSGIYLSSLTTLDSATAEKLVAYQGMELGLQGLTKLDAQTAKHLAGWQGQRLKLSGLERPEDSVLKHLKAFPGKLECYQCEL